MMSPTHQNFEILYSGEHRPVMVSQSLTVAVSLFNYERFIVECLDSVHAQTHPRIELIVVDDCSTKDRSAAATREWIESHGQRFDRVLLLEHSANYGLAAARNTAFEQARTEYVFVLDADNTLYPRALARLHAAAVERDSDAVYSQLEMFGERVEIGHADVWSKRRFRRGNYVDAMALIRKRSFCDVGGYTHIEGGWEDFDFWCKFVEADMTGLFIPEILCRYRAHGTSMLQTSTNAAAERLKVELMIRHPWLDLK